MNEFIARQNIKSFKAQLLTVDEGPRKVVIRGLLDAEERGLNDWLTAVDDRLIPR